MLDPIPDSERTDSELLRWQEKIYELEAESGAIAGELGTSFEERQKNVEAFLNGDVFLDNAG